MSAWGRDVDVTPGEAPHHVVDQCRRGQPFISLALAMIGGVALGLWWPRAGWWLGAAALPLAVMLVMLCSGGRNGAPGRTRAALHWGLVALVAVAAGWAALRSTHVSGDHVTRYLAETSQLAAVTGTVVSEPQLRSPKRGDFGEFSYMPPATSFRLALESIVHRGERVPVTGMLLARIDAAEHRLRPGQRIEATGWLAPINPPQNPGEVDFRDILAEQGVFGRLTLRARGNWSALEPAPGAAGFGARVIAWRGALAAEAQRVLHVGMREAPDHDAQRQQRRRLALLDALLLGQWRDETRELHEGFRRVGLAHLMAISGAHLGILMGLVWMGARLLTPRPGRAATIALVALAAYLLIVPWRVPIVRAAIMAGVFCAGFARGRAVSGTGLLALAAILVLLWRPGELLSPGFQLSFGIVAALLLFTRPMADAMALRVLGSASAHESWPRRAARRGVDVLAVSIIAFAVALPLVAHHFELVNPLAVVMSVLALPAVTAVLALGYAKMLLGALLPSASMLLASPLTWATDAMLALVERVSAWRVAAIELAQPPPVTWVIAVLAFVAALLWGCFAHRWKALAACALVLLGWTLLTQRPEAVHTLPVRTSNAPTLRVNMLAVGHGSAYVIRVGDRTLMYDCGSQPHLDVGERRIVPALRRLGVRRIDTLFISHAHLDHYSGVLALAEAIDVGEIRAPPQFFQVARDVPEGSAAFLIEQLERRHGLHVVPTVRGWSRTLGEARLDALWPPARYTTLQPNDTSLVLAIQSGGQRLLMTGDMEQDAIEGLIARGENLRADVAELPHHGGWVDSSPDWLEAVSPRVVLQSSTPPRGRRDPWADLLAERDIERLTTYDSGMVELTMRPGEPIRWRAFADDMQVLREITARD